MTLEWYRSLADLIGPIEAPIAVVLDSLPGRDLEPRLPDWHSPGTPEYWYWPSLDGSGDMSSSPVSQWMREDDLTDEPPDALLRRIYEAISLPGEPRDYHFALLGVYSTLWGMRRRHPGITRSIAELCLLDVRLCEVAPSAVRLSDDQPDSYVRIPSFEYLISLYRDEGYIAEALEIAEKAAAFGGQGADIEGLRERMAALEAEND